MASTSRLCTRVALFAVLASPALADEQATVDGCIDKLREVDGPDGQAGEVLSREYSEAASLIMLKDRGGTVWRCLVYSDGVVEELAVVDAADDGQGAMSGASDAEMVSGTQRISFPAGASGTELSGQLMPGDSVRYLLGAKEGQFLDVRLVAQGPGMSYQIFNPDNSFLLDMVDAGQDYRGQLWQSGDHAVEVINRANGAQSFSVVIGIE